MLYRLNNRGAEALGDDDGKPVTIAEVQDIYVDIMGGSNDDIAVMPDGLYLIAETGERTMIAEALDK